MEDLGDGAFSEEVATASFEGTLFKIERFADAGATFPSEFVEMGIDEKRCIDWGVMEYGKVIQAEPYPPMMAVKDGLFVWMKDPRAS